MWNEKIVDFQNLKHLTGFSSTILPTLINTISIKQYVVQSKIIYYILSYKKYIRFYNSVLHNSQFGETFR